MTKDEALPLIPEGDRFKDATKFRVLGGGGGDTLYECWGGAIRAYALAAIDAAMKEQPATSGWKLVPVEPTHEMAAAGAGELPMLDGRITWLLSQWQAMLAAAPPAPQPLTDQGMGGRRRRSAPSSEPSSERAASEATHELGAHHSRVEGALEEWSAKTDLVQKTAAPRELWMHRADVLRKRIEADEVLMRQALEAMYSMVRDHVTVFSHETVVIDALKERLGE